MELVKDEYISELWTVNFYDHKPLSFQSKEDMERYLNHELSHEHGIMEYERVPESVEHTEYYHIEYK